MAAGVSEVYVEGRQGESFDALLRSLRPGENLFVMKLADLAADRRQLRKRMKAVHDKGCFLDEVSTQRNSRRKRDLEGMIFDATETLTHAGKGHDPAKAREYGSKGGRPRKVRAMSEDEAKRHWFDTRYPTNAEALRHMPGWNAGSAYRRFGLTGRQPGPRRPAPKRKRR